MLVTVDPFMLLNNKAARQHPWTTTMHAENAGAYYDFIKNPELIREKLEDFKPHESKKAIQFFYEMIYRLNRNDGQLESCDCLLRDVGAAKSAPHNPYRIAGRLEVIARNHAVNTDLQALSSIVRELSIKLQNEWSDCDVAWIDIQCLPTKFMDMPEEKSTGYRTSIFFEVNGNGGDDAWSNLYSVFISLDHVLGQLEGVIAREWSRIGAV